MTIQVKRYLGDLAGADLVEPMLSEDMLIHRGTAEMDANAQQVNDVQLNIVYRDGVRLGQIVEVPDLTGNWYGKITGLSFSLEHGDAQLQLNIERNITQ